MNKNCGFGINARASFAAAVLAAFIAGCGSGDGEKIFGDGTGGGLSANPGPAGSAPALGAAATLAGLGGSSAGMTNTGTQTQINNGDMGTVATTTSTVSGFHDSAGDVYTETLANIGAVSGKIYTCTTSTAGPTSATVNAASCAIAT